MTSQLVRTRNGDNVYSISTGRRAQYDELWTYVAVEEFPTSVATTQLIATHTAVYSSKILSRWRSFFFTMHREKKMNLEDQQEYFALISRKRTLRNAISTRVRQRKDHQLQNNPRRLQQLGETLCKVNRTVVSKGREKPKESRHTRL